MPTPPITATELATARSDPRLAAALAVTATTVTWQLRAACAGTETLIWFSDDPKNIEETTSMCRQCPVAAVCLAFALSLGEPWGIWGGATPRERRAMRVVWRERLAPAGGDRCHRGHPIQAGTRCGECRSAAATLRWEARMQAETARSAATKEHARAS